MCSMGHLRLLKVRHRGLVEGEGPDGVVLGLDFVGEEALGVQFGRGVLPMPTQ